MRYDIYLASSWRNARQPIVHSILTDEGYKVYDFRNPFPSNIGFAWGSIDSDWQKWNPAEYRSALQHPLALDGFQLDWNAMRESRMCVLLLPCGRSAHLEAGYFIGKLQPTFVLMESQEEPELMYKMANAICLSVGELLLHLKRA